MALIEENQDMFGGTCINVGCIPTKTLLMAAEQHLSFAEAMAQKEVVVTRLRQKNEAVLKGAGVNLYLAHAKFLDNKTIEISAGQEIENLTADTIVINTGATSNQLSIPGLQETKNVFDSTGIQQLSQQPTSLGIIGGGNIGLEFATLYRKLGTKVSVFETGDRLFAREEASVAQLAQSYMEEDGITFHFQAKVESLHNEEETVCLTANGQVHRFDAVLYATGRRPNIEGLGLENTDITLTERKAIQVDEYCQTSVPGIYAVGDVNGGLQFTYTSLDDFRIVFGHLTGQGNYTLSQRKNVPTATFIEPPLARVGLTEQEVIASGLPYKANDLPVANMPRAHVNNDLRGLYKVIVHAETQEILGATLFGAGAHEIINLIKMAMDNHIPYTYIKNQVFTHPTMAENLNDVFNF